MTVIRNLERKACQNVLQIICLASIFALQCSKEFLATQRKRLAANLKVVLASLARVVSSIQHGDARIQSPFLVWNKLRSVQRRANRSRPVRILRQHAHPSSLALSKLLGPFRVDRADSRRGDACNNALLTTCRGRSYTLPLIGRRGEGGASSRSNPQYQANIRHNPYPIIRSPNAPEHKAGTPVLGGRSSALIRTSQWNDLLAAAIKSAAR